MTSVGLAPAPAAGPRWAIPPALAPGRESTVDGRHESDGGIAMGAGVGVVGSGGGGGGGQLSLGTHWRSVVDGQQPRRDGDGSVAATKGPVAAQRSKSVGGSAGGCVQPPTARRLVFVGTVSPPQTSSSQMGEATVLAPEAGIRPTSPSHPVHVPSLFTAYGIVLTSEAARGLLLPSLYPHLLAAGGRPASLGALVAAFSVGRLAATVPLGWASDAASMRVVLAAAIALQVAGHLGYGAAVTGRAPWALIASRVVVGTGSATMSVCRSHVARAVGGGRDLTAHLGWLSGVQFVGFAVLPGVGGALASLPGGGVGGVWWVVAALVAANAMALVALATTYRDPPLERGGTHPSAPSSAPSSPAAQATPLLSAGAHASGASNQPTTGSSYGATAAPSRPPPPDAVVISSLLLLNVALRGIMAALETVATPFLVNSYASLSVASAAGLLSLLGIAGLGVYASMKPLARAASDARLMAAGLTLAAAGSVPLMLGVLLPDRHLPLVATVAAMGLLWSAAYPLGQTAVLSAFAKATRGTSPGAALGLFSASGSGARVGGALIAGLAWAWGGGSAVWGIVSAAAVVAAGGLARVYNRL
ncbi:hypothetical protein MMPV_000170 [Pyropia vietnamensis]